MNNFDNLVNTLLNEASGVVDEHGLLVTKYQQLASSDPASAQNIQNIIDKYKLARESGLHQNRNDALSSAMGPTERHHYNDTAEIRQVRELAATDPANEQLYRSIIGTLKEYGKNTSSSSNDTFGKAQKEALAKYFPGKQYGDLTRGQQQKIDHIATMKTGTKMKKLGAAKDRYGKPLATAAKGGYSAGKKVGG
jgi:hypothetical protein